MQVDKPDVIRSGPQINFNDITNEGVPAYIKSDTLPNDVMLDNLYTGHDIKNTYNIPLFIRVATEGNNAGSQY